MILPDVNVVLYAFCDELPEHEVHRQWLEELVNDPSPFAITDEVLASVVRLMSHPSILANPESTTGALARAEELRAQSNAVVVGPGERHWELFAGLCRQGNVRGNLVPDARLAAIAIENGCTLATNDGDFARFHGLRVLRPAS